MDDAQMQQDIIVNNDAGYLDISFENGDFALTKGLETAILMSLSCDKRASASEVPDITRRRGWLGNRLNDYDNYQIGSKLWLLCQARRTETTLNLVKTYVFDCLQWLVEDEIATKIDVSASFIDTEGIKVQISIYHTQNVVYTNAFTLWQNTNRLSF